MNSDLDRTYDPFDDPKTRKEFEDYLDEIYSLPSADQLQTEWCIDHYQGVDPGEMDQDELFDYLMELELADDRADWIAECARETREGYGDF